MNRTKRNELLTITINKKDVLPFVIVIILIVLMGGNGQNPDISNYIIGYKVQELTVESNYLYIFMQSLFLKMGASFEIFRLFLYTIGLLNIHFAIKKLGANTICTYLCYAISLMMIDATQTYNFLGMSLLFVGTAHLIKDEKHNRKKYIASIILASGFHLAFLFYLPFAFIYGRTDNKQLMKIYIFTTIIVFFLSTVASVAGLAGIIQKVLTFFGLNSYQAYLTSRTRYGHYYPMIVHLISCSISYYFYTVSEKNNYKCKDALRVILLINLYGIFAFPLFRFQLTIARLTRNLELFTFISGTLFLKEKSNMHSQIIILSVLLALAGIMGYFTIYSEYMETIVQPFWDSNWILGRG